MRPARDPNCEGDLDHVVDGRQPADGGRAPLTLEHVHRGLPHLVAKLHRQGNGLGLGVVDGVRLAEEVDGPLVARPEAGGWVGHRLAGEEPDPEGEPLDADASHEGRLETLRLDEKARADGQVVALLDELDEVLDVGRVMLAVAVHLDVYVIAAALGVLVPRLDGSANAEVLGKVKHVQVVGTADGKGVILRAVIDDDVVIPKGPDLVDGCENALVLVVGGNDYEHARSYVLVWHRTPI